ncbi:MAG TPA: hypothetical protein VGJ37_19240, partial [Pyrinomonadaceae bacterium]
MSNRSVALSQTSNGATGQCDQIPVLYQLANFTVKHITAEPMVKFVTDSRVLDQSLAAALASPGSGLSVNQRFDVVGVSFLESKLNEELELRTLRGRMGLIFARHRLINCDDTNRTLDVQYQVLTVARPSYLRNSFEALDRRQKNKEAAGSLSEKQKDYSLLPFAGYNRSRGIFGGSGLVVETDYKPLNKLAVSASGSSSSAVVEFDVSGSKNFSAGPLSFAEWRAVYNYSNIPTDGFDLVDATGGARFFAATRPISSRNLIFRFGASIEGGNRQSSLPQSAALPSTLVDSGYGALKLYAGASLTTRRQDLKASYGLQLGNTGEDLKVDYRKQIFDSAYRLRFLPKPYKPFQLDVQFTAGSLTTVSGPVPYGERYFGGNVEQEFIQGDSWKIRSNPVIRSFPQNRLNGGGGLVPVGGDDFMSVNLTAAQTIWQKQLIPREIGEDPDVNAGLGGQLLATRLFLREEAVQQSKEIKALETQVGCVADNTAHTTTCLTPIVNRLKTLLAKLLAQAGPDDALRKAINSFSDDDGSNPLGDVDDAINGAKLNPDAFKKSVESAAELAAIQANPVEGNANLLVKDDPGDPADPDDDTVSLLTVLQKHIKTLQELVPAENDLGTISGSIENARKALQQDLTAVDSLRAYNLRDVQDAKDALDQPAGSGRKLDELLVNIRALLKPEREAAKAAGTKESDYRDLLDATDTYADKARSAYVSVHDSFDNKDYYGVKIDVERLTVGFGGLFAYLTGLEVKIGELDQPLIDHGRTDLLSKLKTDLAEVRLIQRKVQSAYKKIRIPKAEVTANQTVTYVGRILGVFFRETNIVAVSPVLMFDAARLRVNDVPGTDRFRYGVGSGIRFSLINVDFTAGYSF